VAVKEKACPKSDPNKISCQYYSPKAAGIDIGAEEIFVAIPADRDPEPVRRFRTFTPDLHELAGWINVTWTIPRRRMKSATQSR
jgi:hypothetical protein